MTTPVFALAVSPGPRKPKQKPQKDRPLTEKQHAFCLAYMETGSGALAYRAAYRVGEKTTPSSVARCGSQLLHQENIQLAIKFMRDEAAERSKITVDKLVIELEEARKTASTAAFPQASAMVAATLGKAKLLGLLTDKVDTTLNLKSLPSSIDELV